ncbi:MAG: hypothetical protein M1816_006125 [Peltula sp. TS41687]|nr:MAG: hypothetical protein M1816_006125 [Peltula sp. TS41687]
MDDQQQLRISTCKAGVQKIRFILQEHPEEATSYLNFARSITRSLDMTGFISDEDLIWMVEDIQRLAFYDSDNGGVQDLATWCEIQWLKLLHNPQSRTAALIGLGRNWLERAQKPLAIITQDDVSPSSETTNSMTSDTAVSYTQQDDDAHHEQAVTEAAARLHTANYVEARGLLQPATDFFSRAVRTIDKDDNQMGELLEAAAEAYRSLATVSYQDAAEGLYVEALRYVRRASQIPNHALDPALQE